MKRILLFLIPTFLVAASTISINQLRVTAPSPSGQLLAVLPGTQLFALVSIGPNCTINSSVFNCNATAITPQAEVPAGTMDGVNAKFTLQFTPIVNTQLVFRNGVCYFPGAGDYTIAGNTVTFSAASIPQPGDTLIVQYWH